MTLKAWGKSREGENRAAKTNFDSKHPEKFAPKWRTWCDFQQGKQVELSLASLAFVRLHFPLPKLNLWASLAHLPDIYLDR